MPDFSDKQLSPNDIVRLGCEAGLAVLTMPEYPTQHDIDNAVSNLGMRVVELTYTQPVMPEQTND